jgi:hypothetical protein
MKLQCLKLFTCMISITPQHIPALAVLWFAKWTVLTNAFEFSVQSDCFQTTRCFRTHTPAQVIETYQSPTMHARTGRKFQRRHALIFHVCVWFAVTGAYHQFNQRFECRVALWAQDEKPRRTGVMQLLRYSVDRRHCCSSNQLCEFNCARRANEMWESAGAEGSWEYNQSAGGSGWRGNCDLPESINASAIQALVVIWPMVGSPLAHFDVTIH